MKKIGMFITTFKVKQVRDDSIINIDESATYKDLMLTILNKPIEGGSISEQRKVSAVMDKVEAAKDILLLEDAEWETLKARAERFSWGIISKEIVAFVDSILNAETVTLEGYCE
jgi:hypothetical protein